MKPATPKTTCHITHTLNCVSKYKLDANALRNFHPANGLLIQVRWKAAGPRCSPTIKSLIFLTPPPSSCTQRPYLPILPPLRPFALLPSVLHLSPPRFPKTTGWPCASSVSVQRQEKLSSRCTTPHLIQGGKLLCEINSRPSLNPCAHTHTCLEFFCDLQCREQSSCHEAKTSRLPSSSSSETWHEGLVVDCLTTRRVRKCN